MAATRSSRKARHRRGVHPAVAGALQKAHDLEQRGELQDAWDHYLKILKIDPHQVNALNRLGVIAGSKEDYSTAALYFSEAVRCEPKDAALRSNLGVAYLRADDYGNALIHLRKARSLDPRSVEVIYNLGDCYLKLEKSEQAHELAERLLHLDPDHKRGQLLRARIFAAMGRMDDAEMAFRALIAGGAKLPQAYRGLSEIRRFRQEPPELADVEALLEKGEGLSGEDRYQLHFAAGKFAEDCGQYDRAFGHFAGGKQNYRSTFDLAAYAELVHGMRAILTPQFFRDRRDFASSSVRPVFIFGMPRSGTTLSERIISGHPQAATGGELPYFENVMRELGFDRQRPAFFLGNIARITSRDAARIADDYLAVLRRVSRNADRIVDKMPHNFEHVWLMALLFPEASFVHVRRNPLATCVSCFTSPLNEAHSYSGSLDKLGRYYRLYDQLTRHWDEVVPVAIMTSRYEDVISDPEGQSRRLIAHIGLEWNDACLRPQDAEGPVRTLSSWQVRQPVYRTSVSRWRRYDAHLRPLREALGHLGEVAEG